MKRIILTATLFLGLATLGFSQQRQGGQNATPEERAQRRTEMLTKQLSLTQDQQEKVHTLALDQANKMQQMRSNSQGDREERMKQMRSEMEQFDAKLKEILTPEQQKTYDDWQKQRQQRFQQGGRRGGMQNGQNGQGGQNDQ